MTKKKSRNTNVSEEVIRKSPLIVSSEVMADIMDVTSRALNDWKNKMECPQHDRGQWNVKDVVQWKLNEEESANARKIVAEANLKETKAEKEEFGLAVLKGEYLPIEDIKKEWTRRVVEVKSGLFALVHEIAEAMPDAETGRTAERIAGQKVRELLEQYARNGTYTPKTKT